MDRDTLKPSFDNGVSAREMFTLWFIWALLGSWGSGVKVFLQGNWVQLCSVYVFSWTLSHAILFFFALIYLEFESVMGHRFQCILFWQVVFFFISLWHFYFFSSLRVLVWNIFCSIKYWTLFTLLAEQM